MRRFLAAIFLAGLAGCSGSAVKPADAGLTSFVSSHAGDMPAVDYRVSAPDALVVSCPRVKVLDGNTVVVRADGKVSFNLIGDLYVAGKTTDEIAGEIAIRLRKFYDKSALDVVVSVAEYRSKFIFVMGQVLQQGKQPYTGSDSLLKVLAEAKFNDDAWTSNVIVVRQVPDIATKITIDVKQMYESGDVSSNIRLQDGDLVYVPPTPLARVGKTFSKLVLGLQPVTQAAAMAGGI